MGKTAIAILHGYNSSPLYMRGVELGLKKYGKFDQILNLNVYGAIWAMIPSKYNLSSPIIRLENGKPTIKDSLCENVLNQLKEELDSDVSVLFLLGHSMGGLIWRALIKSVFLKDESWRRGDSPKIGGLIQLASPNQGSQLTNLRIVEIFDKIQSAIYVKLAGYSVKFFKKLANLVGIETDPTEISEHNSQIEQMKPGSVFLDWLNSPPTYVDKVRHYILVGKKNSLYVTNLAWIEETDEKTREELIEAIKQQSGMDKDIDKIIEQIESTKNHDTKLMDLIEQLKHVDENETSVVTNLSKYFKSKTYADNDGMVGYQDTKLEGAIRVDLEEHAEKITHFGICLWFLPFDQYKAVENKTLNICDKLLEEFV